MGVEQHPIQIHIFKKIFSNDDIIKNSGNCCQKVDVKRTDKDLSLPIMYCLPKLHKKPTGARFLITFKNFSTKSLSSVISKIFKMLFKYVENFHDKITSYSSYKKFWDMKNSFPIIEKISLTLEKMLKKSPPMILALCIPKNSKNLLIKVLSEIIRFVFKSKLCSEIGFPGTLIY